MNFEVFESLELTIRNGEPYFFIMSNRRSFLKQSLAVGMAAGPINCFFSRRASAAIPVGNYLEHMPESSFWFRQLAMDRFQNEGGEYFQSVDGQLTLRLGMAGGVGTGYFSTLSFLSEYRSEDNENYQDLLKNIARLPRSLDYSTRKNLTLSKLAEHRKIFYANRRIDKRQDQNIARRNLENVEAFRIEGKESFSSASAFPLEETFDGTVASALEASVNTFSLIGDRAASLISTSRSIKNGDIPIHEEGSKALQDSISEEFLRHNPSLETRFASVDTRRLTSLTKEEDGTEVLKLDWINPTIFTASYGDGIDAGRLAGLGYFAFLESGQQLKSGIEIPESFEGENQRLLDELNDGLKRFALADELLSAFGDEMHDFFGFKSGGFRPAVRLKHVVVLGHHNGEGAKVRVEFMTPFLPFEVGSVQESGQSSYAETQDQMADAIVSSFSQPIFAMSKSPLTTASFENALVPACAEIRRHTSRTLRGVLSNSDSGDLRELGQLRMENSWLVPEATSPWCFSGVASALAQTYLTKLHQNSLKTFAERFKFTESMRESAARLMVRSVGVGEETNRAERVSFITKSSPSSPALVEYASGFRAAGILSARVSDEASAADGARKVYAKLTEALPEFFQSLPQDAFLSADQIAEYVGTIAVTIDAEIKSLRLQNTKLKAELEHYKKFVSDLSTLIDRLQSQISQVNNTDALKKFQASANELIQGKMQTGLDAAQVASLGGLQGLVNTFAQVGVNIDANVRASVKVNVQFCSVGGAK